MTDENAPTLTGNLGAAGILVGGGWALAAAWGIVETGVGPGLGVLALGVVLIAIGTSGNGGSGADEVDGVEETDDESEWKYE